MECLTGSRAEVHQPCRQVSVVIPTFNRRDKLAAILQPVLDDPETGEIVVVVDGGTDGSFEMLEEWSRLEPRIRAVFQENAGDAAARQRGIEEAKFDVVVVLDDDVVASKGMIGAHARHHADGARRLVLGYMPTRVPEPRRPGQVATVLYAEEYDEQCRKYEADPDSILRSFWMGNMSLSRDGALAVGFGTKLLIRRHSDMEFGIRCKEAHFEAEFDRSLLAEHSHSRSLTRFAAEARASGEARERLMREYPALASDIDPMNEVSRSARTIARFAGSPWMRPLCARLAMAASAVAGRLRLWRVETAFAKALRRIEISYGFRSSQKLHEGLSEIDRYAVRKPIGGSSSVVQRTLVRPRR
jgi:glycosyltransferase involved in cell wall biosynthesis